MGYIRGMEDLKGSITMLSDIVDALHHAAEDFREKAELLEKTAHKLEAGPSLGADHAKTKVGQLKTWLTESPDGLTRDEIHAKAALSWGEEYNKGSLSAMLWTLVKKHGAKHRDGRYFSG